MWSVHVEIEPPCRAIPPYLMTPQLEVMAGFFKHFGKIVKVLCGLVVFTSLASNHRLSLLLVRVPQVAMLRTWPNMALAVERHVKPQVSL